MQLSLMTDSLGALPFEAMAAQAATLGFQALELGCGNWSSAPHLALDDLLASPGQRQHFQAVLDRAGLTLAALNCSGNQLAPDEEGERHRQVVTQTFRLAGLLGVRKVVMMSGLPAGGPGERVPNWITTSWPPRNADVLEWQWQEVALPYWRMAVQAAREHGIEQIALENHGCQLVYNPATLLRLRQEIGPMIGMNLDPSHLFWMGGDPIQAVRALGPALYHVHAKDVRLERGLVDANGVLDTQTIDRYAARAWNYVALGHGHDVRWWKEFFTVVRMAGYDGAVSLEMEDVSMPPAMGIHKSLRVLAEAMPVEG